MGRLQRIWHRIKLWHREAPARRPAAKRLTAPVYSHEDLRALLTSLASHPGFQYLLIELNNRHASLSGQLDYLTHDTALSGTPEDFRKIVRLQEAVFWSGWLQRQTTRALTIASREAAATQRDSDVIHVQ